MGVLKFVQLWGRRFSRFDCFVLFVLSQGGSAGSVEVDKTYLRSKVGDSKCTGRNSLRFDCGEAWGVQTGCTGGGGGVGGVDLLNSLKFDKDVEGVWFLGDHMPISWNFVTD